MPFGNSPPNRQPLECLGPQRFSNPKGIASSSPGLRGPRYPGSRTGGFSTPTGLRPASASGAQPRWGCGSVARFPRVARASQPWASSRNSVGIQRANSRRLSPPLRGGGRDPNMGHTHHGAARWDTAPHRTSAASQNRHNLPRTRQKNTTPPGQQPPLGIFWEQQTGESGAFGCFSLRKTPERGPLDGLQEQQTGEHVLIAGLWE